jgi:L-Ala-D/L-Glu epimerase
VKITQLTFRAAELPLIKPLSTARGTIISRRIIAVMLHGEDLIGIGEAAPFSEHGTESFDHAYQIISTLAARTEFPSLTLSLNRARGWLKSVGVSREFAPATAWSLECAIASLIAQKKRVSLPALFTKSCPQFVPVSAVIGGRTTGEILGAAEKAVAKGYHTIKVKLGMRLVVAELETIRKLRQLCGDHVDIRVDANEAWSLEQAIAFCQGARNYRLEYIEDPLRDPMPERLRVLRSVSPVALALDQFANKPGGFEQILKYKLCRVVVLKPAEIGSFVQLRRMARDAREHKISVVISNLIESSIGLGYATVCAAVFGSRKLAHGLGTASLLSDHLVSTRMIPTCGNLSLLLTRFLLSHETLSELTTHQTRYSL